MKPGIKKPERLFYFTQDDAEAKDAITSADKRENYKRLKRAIIRQKTEILRQRELAQDAPASIAP